MKLLTLIFLLSSISIAEAQDKKMGVKDSTLHLFITAEQEKLLSENERQQQALEQDRLKMMMWFIVGKDSTYAVRLTQFPIHRRKEIVIVIKK